MSTKLNSKPNISAVAAYAEAWRNKQVIEKQLDEAKEAMQAYLEANSRKATYTYADGSTVEFKLILGHRTDPVTFEDAQKLTGFSTSKMLQLVGKIDAKKTQALMQLGKINVKLGNKLLPTSEFWQVRGLFQKD
jgi:hypothetical protein